MSVFSQASYAFQDEFTNFNRTGGSVSSLISSKQTVRVDQHRSRWMSELKEQFDCLVALPKGWDGYDGCPVSFTCANFTANLIERLFSSDIAAPSLVPGSDGTLQIEWHINQFDIEIDILGPNNVVATRYDHVTKRDEELEIDNDFTTLATWISDLLIDREEARRLEM